MRITCTRCNREGDAAAEPPMPTELGKEIHRKVCPACWKEWLGAQIVMINEYRLNLMDPQARKALEGQMRTFLNLPAKL